MALAGLGLAMCPVQADEAKWREVVDRLRDFDPPRPNWAEVLDAKLAAGLPVPPAPVAKPPSDRAAPELLRSYWTSAWPWENGMGPSPEARRKIMQAVRKYPDELAGSLVALSTDAASLDEVAEMMDKLPDKEDYEKNARRKVRAWLFRHGGRMREQVLEDCLHPDWEAVSRYPKPDPSLDAVAAREPLEAERILRKLVDGPDPRSAVLAAGLLERGAAPQDKEGWRKRLLAAAENRDFSKDARRLAVRFLAKQEWPGRDAWVLSRLRSPDCGDPRWFDTIVEQAPKYWIPILAEIARGEDRGARNRVVDLLLWSDFDEKAAPDALRILLPWLTDPTWADNLEWRKGFLQQLAQSDLPECTGLLTTMLVKEESSTCIESAATILARYHVKAAVPALKEALARCQGHSAIAEVVESIRSLEEFSHAEILAGLQAYYTAFPTDDLRDGFGRGLGAEGKPAEVIGQAYAKKLPDDAVLVQAILQRSHELLDKNPPLAANLQHGLMIGAPTQVEALFAQRISKGSIRPDELAAALFHCRDKNWDVHAFDKLRDLKGSAAAILAVLTHDRPSIASVLAAKDQPAWTALLEAARLAKEPLDFKRVAELMVMDDYDDSGSARNYLQSREEPEARNLVNRFDASEDPNSLASWDPQLGRFGRAGEIAEFLKNHHAFVDVPKDIISLQSISNGSSHDQWHVVIGNQSAWVVHEFRGGRIGVGRIDPETVAQIRAFLTTYQVDELESLVRPEIADGVCFSYLHASAAGIRTLYIENPPSEIPSSAPLATMDRGAYSRGMVIYGQWVDLIRTTVDSAELKLTYTNGAQIVVANEVEEAVTVWARGKDLRILTGEGAGAKWLAVDPANGAIRGPAEEPAECPVIKENKDSAHVPKPSWFESRKSYTRAGDGYLYVGKIDEVEGIWRYLKNEEPKLIAKGTFLEPLATADGKWCVVAKTADGKAWDAPNSVVRIDLTSLQLLPVALEAADEFNVRTYLPGKGKFLLERSRGWASAGEPGTGPESPEFHLLDAASGALERVEGDFEGLENQSLRPLQIAQQAGSVWMARPDGNSTHVGRYDLGTFQFEAIREIKGLTFQSTEMWVDAEANSIYAVVNGDLIRLPLQ